MTQSPLSMSSVPELESLLEHATPAKRRQAALAACSFALNSIGLRITLVDDVLAKLKHGDAVAPDRLAELSKLADQKDEEYGTRRLAYDEQGDGSPEIWGKLFDQARALAAVVAAAHDDAETAINEALTPVVEVEQFRATLSAILESPKI